jgi:50S ribosomal protein L16 3-hydroxylase
LLYLRRGMEQVGVALEECYTYWFVFREPRGAELGAAFLDWLHERGLPDAVYRDRGLEPAARPARIPAGLVAFSEKVLSRIRWSRRDVADFTGRYLSAPKPHVVFRRSTSRGRRVRLDAKTQLLYLGERFFLNGESLSVRHPELLRELADRREADLERLAPLAPLLAQWRRAGYLHYTKRKADG